MFIPSPGKPHKYTLMLTGKKIMENVDGTE